MAKCKQKTHKSSAKVFMKKKNGELTYMKSGSNHKNGEISFLQSGRYHKTRKESG